MNRGQIERDHIFKGEGLFSKNFEPIEAGQAKEWFLKAETLEEGGDSRGALSLYERFVKRRTDAVLERSGENILVGPEALFRAALIRERIDDPAKAFEWLDIIAEGYTNYDYDKVLETQMRVAQRFATRRLPLKFGFIPRIRSESKMRQHFDDIARYARGPKFAPRALMALAELSLTHKKKEEAIDALERLVNLYPNSHLCEKAYFDLAVIHESRVKGPSYDQGATMKARNFYEDYRILYGEEPAERSLHETPEEFVVRKTAWKDRLQRAEEGFARMNEMLAASKLEMAEYVDKHGRSFIFRWRELGNGPALRFYDDAATVAPQSASGLKATARSGELRASATKE